MNKIITPTNLKLWLPFSEGSGTAVADKSGNGINGTLTTGTTWADGPNGKAIAVDTTHQSRGAITGISGNSYTWILRCKPTSLPSGGLGSLIAETGAYQNVSFGNGIYGWRFVSYYNSANNNVVENFSPQTLNTWYTIAAVRDSAALKMDLHVWVDGGYYTAEAGLSSATAYWSGSTFAVGWLSAAYGFIGLVDDLKVFNRALTFKEISALCIAKRRLVCG